MYILLKDKFKIIQIFFSHCRQGGFSIGKIDSFSAAQIRTMYYPQSDTVFFIGFDNMKYYFSVIAQDSFTFIDVLRKLGIIDKYPILIADDFFCGKFDNLSRFNRHGLILYLSDSYLRSL